MKKNILIVIITTLITCLVTNTARDIRLSSAHGGAERKIQTVLDIIDNFSVYDIDGEKEGNAAANAIISGLGDVYSGYYSQEEFASLKDEMSNSYIGIGVTVAADTDAGKVKVVSVAEGQVAEQMGILMDDYIVAVEGTRYADYEMQELVSAIKGEEGTSVTITIDRDGAEFDLVIERKTIDVETVFSKVIEEDIGYIRVSQFSGKNEGIDDAKDTFDYFKEHMEKLKEENISSLIIDLRNNPGGNLDVVVKIADYLMPEGTITYTEDKNGKKQYYSSDENAINLPMAVLINGASASASEVLSGALRDYELATLVGEKTFGKGVVQSVIPLYDGSGVIITSSRYFTPAGECIHEKGIEPDIKVSMENVVSLSRLGYEEDLQLQKAVEVLR